MFKERALVEYQLAVTIVWKLRLCYGRNLPMLELRCFQNGISRNGSFPRLSDHEPRTFL